MNNEQSMPDQFDVLVIGSGAAGLYAALCLPDHLQVGLITKESLKTGASDWAQGGIAAAIASNDSPRFHLEDTLIAGAGLCDRSSVQFLVEQAPEAIQSLVEMGVAFDRQGSQLAMTLEAAHSHPRVLHAADTTGRAIVSTLTTKVLARPHIKIIAQAVALSLWIDPQTNQCQGASVLYRQQIRSIRSSAVILATGGGGQVYARTTNPSVSTGDGVALAWRAGAIVRDLEFFQFHPTALTKPNAPHFLISEAVRGEGAYLVDEKSRRFAFDYHPSGELAPRDVVSRAIFTHLQKNTADPARACVYLDLRPIESERLRRRFPNIIAVCQQWGVDVLTQPIPVAPAAHYWMGGVKVDRNNRTSIAGLYAIGETASTGVHGGNRLASNSLLECVVFAGQLSCLEVMPPPVRENDWPSLPETNDWTGEFEKICQIRQDLPILMWQSAGICRHQTDLTTALEQVRAWQQEMTGLSISDRVRQSACHQSVDLVLPAAPVQLKTCAETLNLLDIAHLILKSALFRRESRGGHYRSDYPQAAADWQVHTVVEGDRWATEPVN